MAASNLGAWASWTWADAREWFTSHGGSDTPEDAPFNLAWSALEDARARGMPRALVNDYTAQVADAEARRDVDAAETLWMDLTSWSPDGEPPEGSPLDNADDDLGDALTNEAKDAARRILPKAGETAAAGLRALWDALPWWAVTVGAIAVGSVAAVGLLKALALVNAAFPARPPRLGP